MASIGRVRAVLSGLAGLPGLYTAYFTIAGTNPSLAEANDVLGRVRNVWNGVSTLLAPGLTVTVDPNVASLDVASGFLVGSATGTPPAVVTGSGAAELPTATMMGLQLLTGVVVGTRLLRGRSYIGPMAVVTNLNGVPTAASKTSLTTAGGSLLTGATASAPVVWHRPDPVTHTGGIIQTVTGVAVDSKYWIMRSRRD